MAEPEGNFIGNSAKFLGNGVQILSAGFNIAAVFLPGPLDLVAAGVMLVGGTITTFGHVLNGHFKSAANYAISTAVDSAVFAIPYDLVLQGGSMLATGGNTIGMNLANAIINPTQAVQDPKISYSPQAQAKLQQVQQAQQSGGMLKTIGVGLATVGAIALTVIGVRGAMKAEKGVVASLLKSGAAKKIEQTVVPEVKAAGNAVKGVAVKTTEKTVAALERTPAVQKAETALETARKSANDAEKALNSVPENQITTLKAAHQKAMENVQAAETALAAAKQSTIPQKFTRVKNTVSEVAAPLKEGAGQLKNHATNIASNTYEALPQNVKNLVTTVQSGKGVVAKTVIGTGAVAGGAAIATGASYVAGPAQEVTTETVNVMGAPGGQSWVEYENTRRAARGRAAPATTTETLNLTSGVPTTHVEALALQRLREQQLAQAGQAV